MYNKVLIISDNIHLCNELKALFIGYRKTKQEFFVQFSTSPYSDVNDFEKVLSEEVLVYDLKNEDDVDNICSSFDLVLSIHCKQLFPPKLVKSVKCINIHPGYNPVNRGWYPQVFAIVNDLPVGATIHEIDEDLDHGNIIARSFVEKEITDTSITLYNKIIKKEIELVSENLDAILSNTYNSVKPENEGHLFLKKDFRALCEIRLDETMTAGEFINRLRALTHGNYKNAYFIDPLSNRKVYLSIDLEAEV